MPKQESLKDKLGKFITEESEKLKTQVSPEKRKRKSHISEDIDQDDYDESYPDPEPDIDLLNKLVKNMTTYTSPKQNKVWLHLGDSLYEVDLAAQTEKAILFEFGNGYKHWIPKSQMEISGEDYIVANWLAEQIEAEVEDFEEDK